MMQTPGVSAGEDKKNTGLDWWTLIVAAGAALSSIYFGFATKSQESRKEVHEQYSNYVDKIGNASPDVRMGAMYILEDLNKEGEIDHLQTLELLTNFIRGKSPRPLNLVTPKKRANGYCYGLEPPKIDVSTAMKVLAGRKIRAGERPDLQSTELSRLGLPETAQLSNVNLTSADLRCSNLRGVNLKNSDLSGTWLVWADLTNANLDRAQHLDEAVWQHTTCPDGTKSWKVGKNRETCMGHLAPLSAQSPTPSGGR